MSGPRLDRTVHPELFKATAGVYALVDPRTGRVFYVGQSVDIDYRYRQHINPNVFDGNFEKRRWIEGLRHEGLKPRLVVLAECEIGDLADDAEKQFISNFRINGQCELNRAAGGRNSRSVSKLANAHRDDWYQLGLKVKAVKRLIREIVMDVSKLAGPKATSYFIRVEQVHDEAVSKLDSQLARAFPDWANFAAVFYGTISREDGEIDRDA